MLKKNTLSIVIPVYNSEKTLPELLSRLEEVLPGICEAFEVILVNDGSQDSSWGVISQLSQKNNWVVAINLMRNYGQHNALLCGIRAAKNDIIVTMDDDLQNPPKEIPKLIEKYDPEYFIVEEPRPYQVPPLAEKLRSVLKSYPDRFILEKVIPIESNLLRMNGVNLNIYRNLNINLNSEKKIEFEMLMLGKSINAIIP